MNFVFHFSAPKQVGVRANSLQFSPTFVYNRFVKEIYILFCLFLNKKSQAASSSHTQACPTATTMGTIKIKQGCFVFVIHAIRLHLFCSFCFVSSFFLYCHFTGTALLCAAAVCWWYVMLFFVDFYRQKFSILQLDFLFTNALFCCLLN